MLKAVGVLSPGASEFPLLGEGGGMDPEHPDWTPLDSPYQGPKGMIHPQAPWLFYWSMVLMAISLYNVFTVPYRWTFWHYTYVREAKTLIR